ncbi:hypothetical protein MPSEU_000740300 [Mayamaea pseudoterrestris]|nr:hypothetical protein MPSEU_000740300 [Mayamaea pseudoterrestris]
MNDDTIDNKATHQNMSYSTPRPIHNLHREIRSTPDEAEPTYSFERESFLLASPELEKEDEFHRRLQHATHKTTGGGGGGNVNAANTAINSGGGSFWRSSSAESSQPLFTSAVQHTPTRTSNNTVNIETKKSKSAGLLSAALLDGNFKNNNDHGSMSTPTPFIANQSPEQHHTYRRNDSSVSMSSASSRGDKKGVTKQRLSDRRNKLDALSNEFDMGHIIDEDLEHVNHEGNEHVMQLPNFAEISPVSVPLDRSSSDQSTGSLFYGKTPNSGAVLGKSSSLIFPTGVESLPNNMSNVPQSEDNATKRRKINLLLDQCESVRFPFKKKLLLNNLGLGPADLPITDLCGTSLGNSLYKLSLAGNRLGAIPEVLVKSLPSLRHLDISQCEIHQLPERWNLPKLTRLNLSHNRLTDFPEEAMLEGLPELNDLNLYGNKIAEIIIPANPKLLSKLEILNLGYNDLAFLPDDLDQITSLRTLKVMNNFLEKISSRVCDMDIRTIDVSSNPVIQPPIETCERGICSMKRYYHCLRMEEQTKLKAVEEVQKKVQRSRKKELRRPKSYSFGGNLKKALSQPLSGLTPRRNTEESPSSLLKDDSARDSILERDESTSVSIGRSVSSATASSDASELLVIRSEDRQVKAAETILVDDEEAAVVAGHDIVHQDSLDLVAEPPHDEVTVNDTLKVIFVGMAMMGKTSMIKRLIEGRDAVIPTRDERTVGVDIYEWDPKKDQRYTDIDSRIVIQDKDLAETCGDVDVKLSCWDFAGQHVYHATHELFFSPRALYVIVWDLGATNRDTHKRVKDASHEETGAFKLTYDSSDDESKEKVEDQLYDEEESRRADRALERDIDEKCQFWIDCIQSSAPGAAILPVASFADYFNSDEDSDVEAKRRCLILKSRLLKHERRRIQGIKERLKELHDRNRANDVAAVRLRKLLCDFTRPKIIFGDDDNPVVRVSGTKYTGFRELTEKIIHISTGQNKAGWRYPIFHGHVGARIPRMRLEVREAVRTMRDRFKVVEWNYFVSHLRDQGLESAEDISDALHFLTNIGELSYFGGVMTDSQYIANPFEDRAKRKSSVFCINEEMKKELQKAVDGIEEEDDDMDDEHAVLSMDDTRITTPTEESSVSTFEDGQVNGLSQFVFLNPRWLVAAVACILRHDLDREIKETRRLAKLPQSDVVVTRQGSSFYDAHLNCPVITADDACMLWQAKAITKKAAKRAQEFSSNLALTPFEFLQLLLIHFGVFVPIDLSIEKAFLGGKEYTHTMADSDHCGDAATDVIGWTQNENAKFFFLPSLLGACEPADAWTYKSTDSWKTTLCHSILFPDGVPPGLMERLTANVLSSIYAVSHHDMTQNLYNHTAEAATICNAGSHSCAYEGVLSVKEVLCWRTAFFLKLGIRTQEQDGGTKESIVEIFVHIADRDSHLCVGSDYMGVGMRRLIVSGRGQVGDGGRKIWKGGYLLVLKCVNRVMATYGGLEYERQGFCPDCLSKKAVSAASSWDFTSIRSAVLSSEATLRCHHGHRVDTKLIAGPNHESLQKIKSEQLTGEPVTSLDGGAPVRNLLRAVVVVGLWDGKTQKVVRVGSGFVVDRKRGLIVTAAHTLINIWGDKKYPYGEDYYGLPQGKVVIGVIPEDAELDGREKAVFRYFAKIVAKDPSLNKGECYVDACVLRITTKLENDIGGDGEGCGDQPEKILVNNPRALKAENLQSLKLTEKCELEEQVRIMGYNQGGEGLLAPGESLNRCFDFGRGYVCMRFAQGAAATSLSDGGKQRERFKPREEIVVMCPTIGGHSGGACVNQQGEVIGILSRADPAERQRCYISPTSEWRGLVKVAKNTL